MAADERMWRIGEVATATGLTVRALHHYDQIGLVAPSVRTSGGHRLYTSADLVLLYEVTAMRQLGLSLDQVGIVLAGRRVIDQQLEIIRLTGDLTDYLQQEKIDAMHRRIGELGVVAEHAVGVEMPRLYGEALEEMRSGTPPSS
jgi:DNA-binding transcriptional MerR regulator